MGAHTKGSTMEHILDQADKQLLKEYFFEDYWKLIDPNFLAYMADWSDEFSLDDYEKLYVNWSKNKTCTFSTEVLSHLSKGDNQDIYANFEDYLLLTDDFPDKEELEDYGLKNSVKYVGVKWKYTKKYLDELKSLVS